MVSAMVLMRSASMAQLRKVGETRNYTGTDPTLLLAK